MLLAIIPARSGSKRIKNKNIRLLNKKPLMIHSLQLCKKSKIFNKIHLSTNSKKYARIAKKFGFEIDFLRNKKMAQDKTPLIDSIRDDLIKFKKKGDLIKEICIVSATSPLLKVKDILDARKLFLKFKKKYPVISVCEFPAIIERGMKLKNKMMVFINNKTITENTQKFTKSFFPTGNIAYYNAEKLLKNKVRKFNYIPLYLDRLRAIDIDETEDLKITKKLLKLK